MRLENHVNPDGPFEMFTTERTVRVLERVTEDVHNIGIHTDITAWKPMEQVFQEYESRLPSTVRKTADR